MKQIQTATCRHCGQIVQFEAGKALTDEQAMEMAVLNCGCEDAVKYQKWMKQEKKALENVQKLFGGRRRNRRTGKAKALSHS